MSSTHTLPVNIFNVKGGETMLARDNETFRTLGKNRTRDPPNTIKIGRSNHWAGGSRVRFSPRAWKFLLSRVSIVSPPSKLKMFTGNVRVLLTIVSLKSSFRSPAEKKNKQEWEHSTVWLFGNYLNAINRPGLWCFSRKCFSTLKNNIYILGDFFGMKQMVEILPSSRSSI